MEVLMYERHKFLDLISKVLVMCVSEVQIPVEGFRKFLFAHHDTQTGQPH
jgi:hypothetical protein